MKCPSCGLDQHYKNRHCKCGYEFEAWKQGLFDDGEQENASDSGEGVAVLRPTVSCLGSIWFHPRKTIGLIADTDPGYLFFPLAMVYWALMALSLALVYRFGGYSTISLVGLSFGAGFIFGPLLFIIASYPVRLLYRVLGGKGSAKTIRTCMAWSAVPFIPALVVVVLMAVVGPEELFTQYNYFNLPQIPLAGPWKMVDVAYKIVGEVLGVWSLVIMLVGISVTEKISIPRVLLAFPLLLAITFVVFLVLGALSGLSS